MNGNEQIRIVLVGHIGSSCKSNERVSGACHDHLHIREACLNLIGKTFCDIQRNFALVSFLVLADATGISTAMAGINADCPEPQAPVLGRIEGNIPCQ